ncbi:fasciclin domain-containing protein [Synechococcales cyanobacterium C]|uniref:Fasciclin domain-containing protein n=1 Tax=Petrachloros mirabilis ULC683 TaxID=2781853 RepID=A0A8K1ZXR4_9CYAN|nr:fasciclin domain-containing protein [Petrachloros mirabilis]NCJ06843.1 fasciclin domain-containing protein [Petrachloros mirabilis ULC683]
MKARTLRLLSTCLLLGTGSSLIASEALASNHGLELSPAAMDILCERFPLNSRCPGGTPVADAPMTPMPSEPTAPAATEMPEPTAPAATEMPEPTAPAAAEPGGTSIVDIASSSDSFSILTQAIEAAGLTNTLAGEGPFTVFAPTDTAFAALPEGALDMLMMPENRDTLVKILTYHVVPGEALSTSLESGSVQTVEGGDVEVTVNETSVMVNNANVVQADIEASNGVIHVIDQVILPPDL